MKANKYLIAVDAGPAFDVHYEICASPETRDAYVADILDRHPDWRVWWAELITPEAPNNGAQFGLALVMTEAAIPRDPGRGA